MATQWPLVVARLNALLPTLAGWDVVTVFDGPPVTADVPTDYVTVGYVADDQAGTYSQTQDPNGFQYVEVGTVRSQLSCITGDLDLASVRARVFALMDAVDAAVRADARSVSPVMQDSWERTVPVSTYWNPFGSCVWV